MAGYSSTGANFQHHAAEIARPTKGWVEKLARAGYSAKGLVYVIVGILALQAAFGSQATPDGSRAAIQAIAEQPFGRVLLGLTAFGLLGYVAWRLVAAIKDPSNRGDDAKGYAIRAGYVVSAFVYAGLAVSAATIAFGGYATGGGGGGDGSKQAWTGWLMSFPFGQWLVAAVGIIVGLVGLAQLYKAYSASFMRDYNLAAMSANERTWAKRIGQFGLAARGVVFCLIAWFIAQAALTYNPQEVHGLGGALNKIAAQPYGQAMMAIVAAGLASYGVFCLTQARWKYFKVT